MDNNDDRRHKRSSNEPITNRFSLIPFRHTKTVHFIRHAQGFHNRAAEVNRHEYLNPKYFDAHLTEIGWQQVQLLRHHLHELRDELRVELVIVSPMMRTLETACGIFGSPTAIDDDNVLMDAQDSIEGVRAAQGCLYKNNTPRILAIEACRERLKPNPCDQRRSISSYKQHFPGIDFSDVASDEDTWWTGLYEAKNVFIQRASSFLRALNERPETRIAVVSHSGFLSTLFRMFGDDLAQGGASLLSASFKNGEMRSVVLCDKHGLADMPCAVSHAGGRWLR